MSEYIKKLRIIDENGDPQDKQIDYNALANLPTSLPANGGTATKAFEDGQGRDIVKTYATLAELANAIHQHEDAYDGLLEVIGNKVDKNEIDNIPTENSEHLVTSGGVYEAIKNVKEEIIDAIILKASNSSQLFKITIDNNGTLRATKI